MEFFAAAITQSSYNAVIFFNDLLKEELVLSIHLLQIQSHLLHHHFLQQSYAAFPGSISYPGYPDLAAAITQSSYNAVIFFNDLLKEELNKQFELMGNVSGYL